MKKNEESVADCRDTRITEPQGSTTDLVFIIDKSGSMSGMEDDTVGGFNSMLEKQKREKGTAYVTTLLFSNDTELLHDRLPLESISPLTPSDYRVGGCTALLDAIGFAIEHIKAIHKYARPEDVPAHTLFIITTDGMENASKRFGRSTVKMLIRDCEERLGWEFLFIAANIDVKETATEIGILPSCAAPYCTESETAAMYDTISDTLSCYRKTGRIEKNWADGIGNDLKKR